MGILASIWSIASLDLLLWRRMPMAIASALIPPIGMTVLLVVLSFTVLQQPVALVVDDPSGANVKEMDPDHSQSKQWAPMHLLAQRA